MRQFAEDTSVPVERSKAQIEGILSKYGASQYSTGWDEKVAFITFIFAKKQVVFMLPLPDKGDKRFTQRMRDGRPMHKPNSPEAAHRLWEQACRQRWRALHLVIKAKLEAVQTGITTFEQEFLAHITIPGTQKSVGDVLIPQLESAYTSGTKLLPMIERNESK